MTTSSTSLLRKKSKASKEVSFWTKPKVVILVVFLLVAICFSILTPLVFLRGKNKRNPSATQEEIIAMFLEIQKRELPRILKELKDEKKKKTHWIWWVFPNPFPGSSAGNYSLKTKSFYVVTRKSAKVLLGKAPDMWKEVLEEVEKLVHTKQSVKAVFPSIDTYHLARFIAFWTKNNKHWQKFKGTNFKKEGSPFIPISTETPDWMQNAIDTLVNYWDFKTELSKIDIHKGI